MAIRRALVVALLFPLILTFVPEVRAATGPPGLDDELVAQVSRPTALASTPDGRMLIASQAGTLWIYEGERLGDVPTLDLTDRICSDKERGLLGVAVDPEFAGNRFIYLFYTARQSGDCAYNAPTSPVNRVSRWTLADSGVVADEVILIDNIAQPGGIHNGGDLQFGKDGYLYVAVGDGSCDLETGRCGEENGNARRLNVLNGKILRITRDGDVPATNPYADGDRCRHYGPTTPGRVCAEIFASGLRNPFRMAFDPNVAETRFFINDVGRDAWEEINLGQAGADYGWNEREGPCVRDSTTDCSPPPDELTDPIYAYPHGEVVPAGSDMPCNAITGGAFVPDGVWPASLEGAYLFGDFVCGAIFALIPVDEGSFRSVEVATGEESSAVVTLMFGPDVDGRALYYATRREGGEIRRLRAQVDQG